MTTTDQRPATVATEQQIPLSDPRTAERMVAPVARCAVEIIRDMRPENALARIVTPEVATMLSRRAALTLSLIHI